jgi:hypothetical protein
MEDTELKKVIVLKIFKESSSTVTSVGKCKEVKV